MSIPQFLTVVAAAMWGVACGLTYTPESRSTRKDMSHLFIVLCLCTLLVSSVIGEYL